MKLPMTRPIRKFAVVSLIAAMAVVQVPVEAVAQGFLKQFERDLKEARRDLRRKMGVDIRVERQRTQPRQTGPRGPVIRRESGLVATSLRPEMRPGTETRESAATALPESRAGRNLETLLSAALATGDVAPEVAQVIRAGSFPTMEELEARTAALGNGWLPGGVTHALEAGKVVCSDSGSGGCAKVAEDATLADVREEIGVIEAQAEAVMAVAAVPGLAEAMEEVAAERAAAAEPERAYPVARGEELPPIDSLLDAQGQ